MATEIKKVLTIDTTSLKEYKKHIDELRGSLLSLEKGSEEYAEVEAELIKETTKLSEVLKAGKKEVEHVSGSYYDLNKQLIEAKKQWKALSEEDRNSEIGRNLRENITRLDGELKSLDASIGQYQRNVGNYGSAFASAFKSAKDGIIKAVPAVGMFSNALKLLAANPIGAVITAVVIAVTALSKAMKGSEAQTKAFKVALAPLKIVFDGIQNAISLVTGAIVKLAEKMQEFMMKVLRKLRDFASGLGFDKMAEGIDNVINKINEYTEIEKAATNISEKRRKINQEIALTENKVAELRAKLAEKDKLSTEERLKLIDEWEKAEKHKAELEVQLAQEEYDLIKRQNALTESSTEDLDRESEAYINLIKAQGAYNESLRSINRERASLLKKSDSDTSSTPKSTKKEEVDTSYKERYEDEMKLIEKKADHELFYNDLLVGDEKEKAEKKYEIEKQLLEDRIKIQEDYLKDYVGKAEDRKKEEEKLADYREELERRVATEQQRLREQEQADLELDNQKKIDQLERDADNRRFYAELYIEDEEEKRTTVYEIERKLLEDKIELQRAYIEDFKGTNEELLAEEQKLADLRIDLERKVATEQERLRKKSISDEKNAQKQKLIAAQGYASAAAGLFDSLADMSEENSKTQKAFAIMSATINTLNGIVSAISGAMSLGPIMGPIMGAINSAAVLASGIAQISKIKQTTKENAGSSLSNSGGASSQFGSTAANVAVSPLLNEYSDVQSMQSLNVNGDSEYQKDTKVYVLEQDITDAQNNVKTRVSNATF